MDTDGHGWERGPGRAGVHPVNETGSIGYAPYYDSSTPSRAARVLPLRWQPSDRLRMVADAWPLVPEGHRRKLAGGKPAPAGAAPGCKRGKGHAPAGHRRSFWHRPRRSVSATTRRLGPVGPPVIGPHPGPFLRCPAGARSHAARFPGAASAGADLPPANLLRRPSGTGTGRPPTDHGKPPAREWRSQGVRLRLRRTVYIASRWSLTIFPAAWSRLSSNRLCQGEPPPPKPALPIRVYPCPSVVQIHLLTP